MAVEPPRRIEPRRIAAWVNLAEHFLDTETRHEVPGSALLLVESDFSISEARAIWDEEVAPAVGFNLALVAGEWAGWDEEWLVERIVSRARGKAHPLLWVERALAWLVGIPGGENRAVWTAIAGCMDHLQRADASVRRRICADLSLLARLFFDFCAPELADYTAGDKRRLATLYGDVFLPILSPLVVPSAGESLSELEQRVQRALGFWSADVPTPRNDRG